MKKGNKARLEMRRRESNHALAPQCGVRTASKPMVLAREHVFFASSYEFALKVHCIRLQNRQHVHGFVYGLTQSDRNAQSECQFDQFQVRPYGHDGTSHFEPFEFVQHCSNYTPLEEIKQARLGPESGAGGLAVHLIACITELNN